MTPRCFLTAATGEPPRTREEIFSNVKAGIVNPLVVELKHSWNFPRDIFRVNGQSRLSFPPPVQVRQSKHNPFQMGNVLYRIAHVIPRS
jgi:hypothetical protein